MSPTLKSAGVHAVCYTPTLVLNDMGGAVMYVSYDVTSTLRSQTKHHEPIVLIEGARAVHQNGSGEVRVSETAYTVSTNSNPSGRNTPLVWIYDARGNGGATYPPQLQEITKTESRTTRR